MCYLYDDTKRSWQESLVFCQDHSSTLASIPDLVTNEALSALTDKKTWLGAYKDAFGNWKWIDGPVWNYEKWGTNLPNNVDKIEYHLGFHNPGTGDWDDFHGEDVMGCICQYKPLAMTAPSLRATNFISIPDSIVKIDQSGSECKAGWTYLKHTNRCYKFDSTKRVWQDAQNVCTSQSATLASICDQITHDALILLSAGWTWVGGYQENPRADAPWKWIDGSVCTGFNNWGPNQPDNNGGKEHHLGLHHPSHGFWNDFQGHKHKAGSICQYDPVLEGSSGTIINLEKLYTNTIPIKGSLTVPIQGSLTFDQDVTLKAHSTIGSLGPRPGKKNLVI